MGKIKNKSKEKKRQELRMNANPVGLPSVEQTQKYLELEKQDNMFNNNGQQQVPPLVQQLDSINESERENACLALANIVMPDCDENQEEIAQKLNLLQTSGGIKKLCEKLVDPAKHVRIAAAGALRNLTAYNGPEVSEMLVQSDITTTLLACFQQGVESYMKPDEDEQPKKDSKDVLVQTLFLMSFLCENSDKATKLISNYGPILNLFLALLTSKESVSELQVSAGL